MSSDLGREFTLRQVATIATEDEPKVILNLMMVLPERSRGERVGGCVESGRQAIGGG